MKYDMALRAMQRSREAHVAYLNELDAGLLTAERRPGDKDWTETTPFRHVEIREAISLLDNLIQHYKSINED